jgi:hypothetical protein
LQQVHVQRAKAPRAAGADGREPSDVNQLRSRVDGFSPRISPYCVLQFAARSSQFLQAIQSDCPTGKSVNLLSSPLCKNISLHPSGKSSLQIRAIPSREEGRIMIVTDAGWDAVDAAALGAQRDAGRVGERPVSNQTAS